LYTNCIRSRLYPPQARHPGCSSPLGQRPSSRAGVPAVAQGAAPAPGGSDLAKLPRKGCSVFLSACRADWGEGPLPPLAGCLGPPKSMLPPETFQALVACLKMRYRYLVATKPLAAVTVAPTCTMQRKRSASHAAGALFGPKSVRNQLGRGELTSCTSVERHCDPTSARRPGWTLDAQQGGFAP
jgi:hypothetical protein